MRQRREQLTQGHEAKWFQVLEQDSAAAPLSVRYNAWEQFRAYLAGEEFIKLHRIAFNLVDEPACWIHKDNCRLLFPVT